MRNFNEIIKNIETELHELKTHNELLMEENALLRKQLELPTRRNSDYPTIEEAFELFYIKEDTQGLKLRAYNVLTRFGNSRFIGEYNGKTIYDIFKLRNSGVTTCAIIVIILEHFGVIIEFPNCDKPSSSKKTEKEKDILKIKEKIKEYRNKIVFDEYIEITV